MSEQHESWLAMIQGLREGQPEAAERLWKAFSPKLEDYAKRKFGGLPRRAYDEEDVALSAMMDFTEGIRNHRFPDLSSEESLARILFVIADRKVLKRIRHQTASKRGGGDVRGESVFFTIDGDGGGMGQVASAANEANGGEALGQECLELLDRLGDDELRTIAILRLQGYTTGNRRGSRGLYANRGPQVGRHPKNLVFRGRMIANRYQRAWLAIVTTSPSIGS